MFAIGGELGLGFLVDGEVVQRGSEDAYFETLAFVMCALTSNARVLEEIVNQTCFNKIKSLLELNCSRVENICTEITRIDL